MDDALRADLELGKLIDKQAEENTTAKQDREALWAESVRRYNARRSHDLCTAWCEHYRKMRGVHWGLGDEYDQKLRELENGHHQEEGRNGYRV